jgi:diadenosine tetraphosphate (Ap4A) HIT family hydrolase
MMVDPHVHFHVIPRYDSPRTFGDVEFLDTGLAGPAGSRGGRRSHAGAVRGAHRARARAVRLTARRSGGIRVGEIMSSRGAEVGNRTFEKPPRVC